MTTRKTTPKIERAEVELKEASDRLHEIEVAIAQIHRGRGEAEHIIGTLQERLPALLAARAMENTGQGEIDRIKAEIRRHRETIEDAEPTMNGLEAMCPQYRQARLNNEREVKKLKRWQDEYNGLKEQIENPTSVEIAPSRFERLRELADALGINEGESAPTSAAGLTVPEER